VSASLVRYDVAVVGGGAAGLAAAVTATAAGARTALVERYGFLGGMATAGMVSTICGLYATSSAGPPEPLNAGFADEFGRRLAAMPGCAPPVRRGRTFVLPYTPLAFACLADELTGARSNLDVFLHAYLVGVEAGARKVQSLRVSTWKRTIEVAVGAVVDASGDAVVAHHAGVTSETPEAPDGQLPSLVFVLQQVDEGALAAGGVLAALRAVAAAEERGALPRGCAHLSLRPSSQPGEVVCQLALEGIDAAPAGRDVMTAAEQEGRRRVRALGAFLTALPGFARAFVSHTAPQIGIRESRRVVGKYRLTREDVLGGRKFDDAVARGGWPIELWREGRRGAAYEYLDDGQTYDIPLRALEVDALDNLFVAGRCMSATHEALGSARVIGTCLAVGAAIGTVAARRADRR
jgi:hypothetical protein